MPKSGHIKTKSELYDLSGAERKEWYNLVVKHALSTPMTDQETARFEALSAKRSKLGVKDPKVKAYIKAAKLRDRKIRNLIAKINKMYEDAARAA